MSEWISVKDRLPDDLQEVLFVFGGDLYLGRFRAGSAGNNTWDIAFSHSQFIVATHWMPLPPPPEGYE